jgi:predicted small secreted protein
MAPNALKRMKTMKRLLTMLLFGLFSVGVMSGCNTMAGAGKDIKGAGQKVEKTADKCSDGKC